MESLSKYAFIFIVEGLFLGLVVAVVWLLISRRQLRRGYAELVRRKSEINTLRQRLELTHGHLQAANERIVELQNAQPGQDDALLLNYQQRIANLEKFKELYFELEDRLALASVGSEQVEQLQMDAQEVDRYKKRVRELEATEARLQQELSGHSRRIKELESRRFSAPAHGGVRLKEMEELSGRLQQREHEIRRLRQECETIGQQYEELAAKSLAMASQRGDLTDDQKSQLEELKRILEENAAALARKQAECEMLENCYLELEQSAELQETAERAQQSYAECNALQEQRRDLNSQVTSTAAPEVAGELAKLQQALADREASLNEIRDDYREIKEQFVQVAQEESELRETHETLKQECETLRSEVSELKESRQDLLNQQEEFEKLRAEYATMESRYLALVKKVQ